MSWSLGETRALAVKAARGTGMPWGMAEEAGFASHWLEQLGLPGTTLLAKLLTSHDSTDADKTLLTQVSAEDYRALSNADQFGVSAEFSAALADLAGERAICPLLLGTMISDGLLGNTSTDGLQVRVSQAGLLLPFLDQLRSSNGLSSTIRLTTESTRTKSQSARFLIRSNPAGETTLLADAGLSREQAVDVLSADGVLCHWALEAASSESTAVADKPAMVQLSRSGERVADSTAGSINKLTSLAARTYAPETDESREKGAGAGTTDND